MSKQNSTGLFPLLTAALFCFYVLGRQAESIFQPLLKLDKEEMQVLTTKLLWSQIERVEVDSSLNSEQGLRWQFFDSNGKRLARVVLSDKGGQNALAIVIAQMLNAKIEVVTPASLASRPKASL